jgi:hypothetical protein
MRPDFTARLARVGERFVVAELLLSQLRLVADGVLALGRTLDRITDELRGELLRVSRRMLSRCARIPPWRRR